MLNIQIKGLDQLRRQLDGFSDRRFAAAVATALTRTAVAVRGHMQGVVQSTFDRPTPHTVRQIRYVAASADRLAAAVGFDISAITDIRGTVQRFESGTDTPASKYLAAQVTGGDRRLKRAEVLLRAAGHLPDGYVTVPGQGARLDAYGNMERGQLIQILSQLRISAVAGHTRNMSHDARKQITAQRRAGGRFFVVPPGGRVQPGVYQREFTGRNITPVLVFVRGARYRARFDFYGIARGQAEQRLQLELRRSFDEHAARLKARSA